MSQPFMDERSGRPAPSAAGPPRLLRTRRATLSIRWIVTLTAVALITASVLTAGAVAEKNARDALTHEIETRILLEARNLALSSTEPLLADFPELALHPLVKEMKARQPELALVLVLDHDGVIQGDPDARRLGVAFHPSQELRPVANALALGPSEQLLGDREVLVALAPVTHRNGKRIGTTMVGLRRDYLDRTIAAARRQQSLVLAGVLLFGTIAALFLMSMVLRPVAVLRQGIERIGRGDLKTPLKVADRTELGMLADAVNDMAAALNRAQAEMLERERLAHEVELARQIQFSLLPNRKTVAGEFVIQGSQRAAAEVGGDYYDFFVLPDGRVGFAVADVAGKGLAGCLVMSMLSALLRAYRTSHSSPSELLAVIDERLGETLQPGSFVTMFYGVLDPITSKLTYSSAGHSPLLVYRGATKQVESLKSGGIPLGAIRGGAIRKTLKDSMLRVDPGDLLVQFTDGVNEAFDPAGNEQFGFERMAAVIAQSASQGCAGVISALHRGVEEWTEGGPPMDDETILVVSREAKVAAAPALGVVESRMVSAMKTSSAGSTMLGTSTTPSAATEEPGTAGKTPSRDERAPSPSVPDAASAPHPAPIPVAATAPVDPHREPLARLAEARALGKTLTLRSNLEALVKIRDWVATLVIRRSLPEARFQLLSTALWEACSNIVEHGTENPDQTIELWWLPIGGAGSEERATIAESLFVIRDHGIPYRADNWKQTDFSDPEVWKRGRGFGLDIIHRVMSRVAYHPGTPEGNITLMTFASNNDVRESHGELRHA